MWNKQPVPRADGGAGPPAHQHILPSVPGDVYTLVRVYRTSELTRSRVLIFPHKLSAPPLAGWVCIYFGWEAPSSSGSRKRVQHEKCSLQTPPEPRPRRKKSLCCGGLGEKGVVSPGCLWERSPGRERQGKGGHFPCSLGSKACSPNTANNRWYLPKADLHTGFSYWLR